MGNLGTLTSMTRPSLEDDGIVIEYTNGSRCGSGNYKTKVILKCVQGALVRIGFFSSYIKISKQCTNSLLFCFVIFSVNISVVREYC